MGTHINDADPVSHGASMAPGTTTRQRGNCPVGADFARLASPRPACGIRRGFSLANSAGTYEFAGENPATLRAGRTAADRADKRAGTAQVSA